MTVVDSGCFIAKKPRYRRKALEVRWCWDWLILEKMGCGLQHVKPITCNLKHHVPTVDGRSPYTQLRLVLYPIIGFSTHPRCFFCWISEPSTVVSLS